MLRVIFGLAGLLLLAGCVSSREPQRRPSGSGAHYHGQGRYGEAEPLYQRALTMTEAVFGATHQNVNSVRYLLGKLHTQQGSVAADQRPHPIRRGVRHAACRPKCRAEAAQHLA